MSQSTREAAPAEKKLPHGHGSGDEHGHHGENEYPYVAHHFDTPSQQLDAGKLGIWLFLVTEILFFAGLFCAYTIYRARYPEVFYWAHFFLDTKWGAVNTIVLILSSLTAAWAVRNAQLGQQKLLVINILVTIACACTFMGVKYVEYSHKAHAGLLPGPAFDPHEELWENADFKAKHPESAQAMQRLLADLQSHRATLKAAAEKAKAEPAAEAAAGAAAPEPGAAAATEPGSEQPAADEGQAAAAEPGEGAAEQAGPEAALAAAAVVPGEQPAEASEASEAPPAADIEPVADREPAPAPDMAEQPLNEELFLASQLRKLSEKELKPLIAAGIVKTHPADGPQLERPQRAHMFFSIYFFMTGLHGLHVLIGIGVWVWLLLRALKGQFGPLYFGPIDFAALYWHLVDLIWIYLFPLLYLIH